MPNFAHTRETLVDMCPEHTPMIRGKHGIGKTELVRQICKEDWGGLRCCELQGSQLSDVGDLIGLMEIVTIRDEFGVEHKESAWVPPYWFPKDGKPFCLFLDEINRAAPPIKRAMMQIGNDHRLLNFALPEGSRVICAVNPNDEGDYDVEEFDEAEQDRFFEIELSPDHSETMDFWRKSHVLSVIIAYNEANKGDTYPNAAKEAAKISTKRNANGKKQRGPSPRSWFKLNKDMQRALARNPHVYDGQKGRNRLENLVKGWVGPNIAGRFVEFYKQHGLGLSPKDILTAPKWTAELDHEIAELSKSIADTIRFGESVCGWILEHEDEMHIGKKITDFGKLLSRNLNDFMHKIPPECAVQLSSTQFDKYRSSHAWVGIVSAASPELMQYLIECSNTNT